MRDFYSHGKLLITGEYVVLDGASALAVPTRLGQSLSIEQTALPVISWKSFDSTGACWFQEEFPVGDLLNPTFENHSSNEVKKRLFSILQTAAELNPTPLTQCDKGYDITARVEFPLDWGLGSSATLLANIAQWFEVDPYLLLKRTFGGSGYDLAVALQGHPLTYQLIEDGRAVLGNQFHPPFQDQLFFVHLNRKQDSRTSIRHYRKQDLSTLSKAVEKISAITHQIIGCQGLDEFKLLLEIHETIISQLINLPTIKSTLFPDFPGTIKSLGGWGGDFIMATGGDKERAYFLKKGYQTVLSYTDLVLD